MSAPVYAALLVIGDEILTGDTAEANLAYLSKALNPIGIQLREARVVPDDATMIADAVNALRHRYQYLFTSGGIGPTHDDITSAAVAAACATELYEHPEAASQLRAYYGDAINPARLKMAQVPLGARLINNPVSVAPGFCLHNIYVMAGVPRIFQAMVDEIKHELNGNLPLIYKNILVEAAEGLIAAALSELQQRYPALTLGSYPRYREGRHETNLVVRGYDAAQVAACLAELQQSLSKLGIGAV